MATKEQIKRIYGMGAVLGIKGSGKDDLLHELIFGMTGKTSVKELDDKEAQSVVSELIHRLRFGNPDSPKTETKSNNKSEPDGNYGMATPEQQKLCWRYCYRLKELDPNPNSADVGDRMVGAIRKVCGTNMTPKEDPFRCVTQESCAKLIEQLKRYVNTAERKAKRQGELHDS
jgi:hypothetical protein